MKLAPHIWYVNVLYPLSGIFIFTFPSPFDTLLYKNLLGEGAASK
jgi:hypothetical protein